MNYTTTTIEPFDPMLEDHPANPVTYPPVNWTGVLEWLLAEGFPILIFPTTMNGNCVTPQAVQSTADLLTHHRVEGKSTGTYVIERGTNALGDEVAWIYEAGVPLEEWHHEQSGCVSYLDDGAEEPDEYDWSHWPHCAMGVRPAPRAGDATVANRPGTTRFH